ncbi:MAG: hypothetical protein AAFY59_17655 [Pseudomonadota bacterium]
MSAPQLIHAMTSIEDLPIYPFSADERLQAHYFVAFQHNRWLNSELFLTAAPEIGWYAINFYFHAQNQTPIGTLPEDETQLARLCRIPLEDWRQLMQFTPNPLHGWVRCLCGDRTRLMHPVVTEVVREALERREAREVSATNKAVYQRLKRLREAMRGAGFDAAVIADQVLVERLDAWLLEACSGRRTQEIYDRAFAHAAREKWYGGANALKNIDK